jgi:hypothetical protein
MYTDVVVVVVVVVVVHVKTINTNVQETGFHNIPEVQNR